MTSRQFVLRVLTALAIVVAMLTVHAARRKSVPLGAEPQIHFERTSVPDDALRQFLDGQFVIVEKLDALPAPIVKAYTEVNGSRPVMANPGERFEETDAVSDSSLPWKRLIFAGVSDRRVFVHYEQGGRGHSFYLALFELTSGTGMKPLWLGACGPAKNFDELRADLKAGCEH